MLRINLHVFRAWTLFGSADHLYKFSQDALRYPRWTRFSASQSALPEEMQLLKRAEDLLVDTASGLGEACSRRYVRVALLHVIEHVHLWLQLSKLYWRLQKHGWGFNLVVGQESFAMADCIPYGICISCSQPTLVVTNF